MWLETDDLSPSISTQYSHSPIYACDVSESSPSPRLTLLTPSHNFACTNLPLHISPRISASRFPSSHFRNTMATANLLRLSVSPNCKPKPYSPASSSAHNPLHGCRLRLSPALVRRVQASATVGIGGPAVAGEAKRPPSLLLDVGGMMCGACASRVRTILVSDQRVESAAVNMLAETAAVRLQPGYDSLEIADELASRLTECGFPSKKRSGSGVAENVKKWQEMAERKEELLVQSRNRVAFAWTLVALCCGAHGSHLLHSIGIHIGHGET